MQPLKAGVFAAGFGSRLREAEGGARRPKALTPVDGRPLIDWILRDIELAGASEIVVIINDESTSVRDHVSRVRPACPVAWIVETTPSSMHSFLRVLETLAADGDPGPFLMSTVDTIAPPGTFAQFVRKVRQIQPADLILALTTRVDDDNPLRVRIGPLDANESGEVDAIGDGGYATAGYYAVRASLLREAAAARAANLPALRTFFRFAAERGCTLRGIEMPESVDVDRPADVDAAARLLRTSAAAGSR